MSKFSILTAIFILTKAWEFTSDQTFKKLFKKSVISHETVGRDKH